MDKMTAKQNIKKDRYEQLCLLVFHDFVTLSYMVTRHANRGYLRN